MKVSSIDHYVQRLSESMKLICEETKKRLDVSTVLQKHYYDRKSIPRKFKIGDAVWLYNPRRKKCVALN